MPGKFDLYAFGEAGVNVVDSVLHVATNQLRQATNAQWNPLGEQKGLCLRPAMNALNADPMAGDILALFPVPFPAPFTPGPEPVRLAALARDIFAGTSTWRFSSDGDNWGSANLVTGEWSINASMGGAPVASGQTVSWRDNSGTYALRLFDGTTLTEVIADIEAVCDFVPVNLLPVRGGTTAILQGNPADAGDPMFFEVDLLTGTVTAFGGARGTRTILEDQCVLGGGLVWGYDSTNDELVSCEIGASSLDVRGSFTDPVSYVSALGETVGLSTTAGELHRFNGSGFDLILAIDPSDAIYQVVQLTGATWCACTADGVYTTVNAGITWDQSDLTAAVRDGVRWGSAVFVKGTTALYRSVDGLAFTTEVSLAGNVQFARRWGGQP